jgi:hypothetical protein
VNIADIKYLVETYSLEQLRAAEKSIIEEQRPDIEVPGSNEGEQLTHLYGAIWISNEIKTKDIKLAMAVRAFSQKVRNSIA